MWTKGLLILRRAAWDTDTVTCESGKGVTFRSLLAQRLDNGSHHVNSRRAFRKVTHWKSACTSLSSIEIGVQHFGHSH